jgi:hypothetical protein
MNKLRRIPESLQGLVVAGALGLVVLVIALILKFLT